MCNFMVVVNFEKLKIYDGTLQIRLKYRTVQNSKHVLLWTPVYEKKVVIDGNLDVTVE